MGLIDGLNIDYQGVEGHGAAQIFGPNKNIDILQDHLKTVADDLAKKRAAIAADKLNLDDKALGTVWEHDIPEISQGKADVLRAEAERQKWNNANPNMYGTPEYIDRSMKVKNQMDDLMFRATQSTQAGKAYNEYLKEYAGKPDTYRPETEAEFAKILAVQGEDKWNGKRSELLNKNPFVYNVDKAKYLKDAVSIIGQSVLKDDRGGVSTTKKNIVFDKDGKLTEWGQSVANPQAEMYLDTQDGRRLIRNEMKDFGLSEEDARTKVKAEIFHSIDTENSRDEHFDKTAEAEKPDVVEINPSGRIINSNQQVINQTTQKPTTKYVDANGDDVKVSDVGGKKIFIDKTGNQISEGVTEVPEVQSKQTRSYGTYQFSSPKEVQVAPEFVINQSTGAVEKNPGSQNYIISAVDKLPYIIDRNGNPIVVSQDLENSKEYTDKQKKERIKYGWFATGTEKAGTVEGQQVNKPRWMPLTKTIYDAIEGGKKGKVKMNGFSTDELWGNNVSGPTGSPSAPKTASDWVKSFGGKQK